MIGSAILRNLGPDSQAVGLETAVQSNSADLSGYIYRSLYVGGTGDVKVTTLDGSVAVLTSVPAGFLIRAFITRVWVTGTTATNLVGYK